MRGVQSVQPDVMTNVKNTVLLETQEPCGSVRKCSGDTVTDYRSVQGKCHIWFQKMFHVFDVIAEWPHSQAVVLELQHGRQYSKPL